MERCLRTIKNQSYRHIELIVVDNNSTDKTPEIAKKYADKFYTKGPERSAQRNFGAKKSKGRYLLIHDSDIYFHKDSVKECVELAEQTNCKAIILPEKSIGIGYWAKVKAFERSFYVGNDLIEAARFFDKKVFLKIGGYDEDLNAFEDWDLNNRIRKYTNKIYRTKLLLMHDEGELNISNIKKKKEDYAKYFYLYQKKNRVISNNQRNIFKRFSPFKVLINGLLHPLLLFGLFVLKLNEFISFKKGLKSYIESQPMLSHYPPVTFIITTYNSDKYFVDCLNGIFMQKYPKNKFDVIIIDGGSKDDTLNIAKKYDVKIENNPHRIAEYGKAVGIKKCTTEYFILLDSDNIITNEYWLLNMIYAMHNETNIIGVESKMTINTNMTLINKYCTLLRISDPLARMLCTPPRTVVHKKYYSLIFQMPDKPYITGANGFLWNKTLVSKYWKDTSIFEEANFVNYLRTKGYSTYAIPNNAYIYHYYANSLTDFVKKRKKIVSKVLWRYDRNIGSIWMRDTSNIKFVLSIIYLATFVGPFIESVYMIFKDRNFAWVVHPIAGVLTVSVYATESITYCIGKLGLK